MVEMPVIRCIAKTSKSRIQWAVTTLYMGNKKLWEGRSNRLGSI